MSGLRSLGLLLGLGYVLAGDQFLLNHHASLSHSFAREWDILGPFQIGTRGMHALETLTFTKCCSDNHEQKQHGEQIPSRSMAGFEPYSTTQMLLSSAH